MVGGSFAKGFYVGIGVGAEGLLQFGTCLFLRHGVLVGEALQFIESGTNNKRYIR